MKIYKETNETLPAVVVLPDTAPTPSGFTEVVDIEEVYNYGKVAISKNLAGWGDELAFRAKLKQLIYTKMLVASPQDVNNPINWNRLSVAEKRIAATYFLIGKESFFLEVENDLRLWTIRAGAYRSWTMAVRAERAELAEAVLFMRMEDLSDAKLVLADLNQIAKDTIIDIDEVTKKTKTKTKVKKLNKMYVEGLEDEEHDGVVAIRDWIKSTVGTPYETNGFMNLTYPLKTGHTYESVRDELLAALDGTF